MDAAIDRAHLDAQTFGDAELARELLALFSGQCRRILPALSDPGRDPTGRADLAHTLKGSAAGVGAFSVMQACAEIESALRGEGEPPSAVHLADLGTAVAAALAEIERLR
ncbi:Hpt domain-containing protein [Methylobacterium trifolii]|uniref:HPt domain-containing protein n=1 Tax=Methylobacterium trifolii TaxID=1003092 RepID=A0ABQ4U5P1_9HYPH|nr:Hpt domain-containing protein [Methylobacterium trifolii]GJE62477.1 hypothetical protein MPOCJGCO_4610 [Methylobacterium trifolii]